MQLDGDVGALGRRSTWRLDDSQLQHGREILACSPVLDQFVIRDSVPVTLTSLPPRASLRLKSSCPDCVSEFGSLVSVWKAMYARIHDRDVNRAADLPCLLRRREGPGRVPGPKTDT
ncbi:hypothetical protein BH18ACT10_BH18ACT10_18230 [soil metagenome]